MALQHSRLGSPPVQLGRQLTSIDVASGGWLIAGLGIGWSPDEYRAAGAPFNRRGAQIDELDALIALWTSTPVKHEGARWSVPLSWVDLKPVQQSHPPVHVGAFAPAGMRRIGRRADGWLAAVHVPGRVHLDALRWQRQAIAAAATAAGRDPASISTNVWVNVALGTNVGAVADVVRVLPDNGYPNAFVDLMYVVTGVDALLKWVQQLPDASAR